MIHGLLRALFAEGPKPMYIVMEFKDGEKIKIKCEDGVTFEPEDCLEIFKDKGLKNLTAVQLAQDVVDLWYAYDEFFIIEDHVERITGKDYPYGTGRINE